MIIHFQTNSKDYVENISNCYIDFDYICPKCGAKHTWRRHGFYERHILYLEDHYLHDRSLKVLRLQCTSCNSTHAILPNDTIPYSIYCLSAFLQITSEVLIHNHSLSQVACHYNISYQLISYFIKRITSFENECKLVLKELQFFDAMNLSSILQLIMSRPTFPSEYFLYTRWTFLMQKFRFIFPKPVYLGCNIFLKTGISTTNMVALMHLFLSHVAIADDQECLMIQLLLEFMNSKKSCLISQAL